MEGFNFGTVLASEYPITELAQEGNGFYLPPNERYPFPVWVPNGTVFHAESARQIVIRNGWDRPNTNSYSQMVDTSDNPYNR